MSKFYATLGVMNMANKKIGIILLLVIFALLSLVIIATNEEVSRDDARDFTQVEQYFIDQITSRALERSDGQPIDGLERSMYVEAFPGLQEDDFMDVETFGDTDQFGAPASPDAVITNRGLAQLLENTADRLQIVIESEEDIDALLVTVSREQPVDDAADDTEPTATQDGNVASDDLASSCEAAGGNWLEEQAECEYMSQRWCAQAGGDYQECMSACRHDTDAEICTMQCVPVCQL